MSKGLAYKREQRDKHINRKKNILRSYQSDSRPHKYDSSINWYDIDNPIYEGMWKPYWNVKHLGQLSKGKIHCSCPMCRAKTRNKGNRRSYSPSINYKPSELRKIEKMKWDETNWENEKYVISKEEQFDESYWWLQIKLSEDNYLELKEREV